MSNNDNNNKTYTIDLLKGSNNYLVWQTKMHNILMDTGLIDYMMGRKPKPETNADSWVTLCKNGLDQSVRVKSVPVNYSQR